MANKRPILGYSNLAMDGVYNPEERDTFINIHTGEEYVFLNGKWQKKGEDKKEVKAKNTSTSEPTVKVSEGDKLLDKETGKEYVKKSGKWEEVKEAEPKKKTTKKAVAKKEDK